MPQLETLNINQPREASVASEKVYQNNMDQAWANIATAKKNLRRAKIFTVIAAILTLASATIEVLRLLKLVK